MFNRGVIQHCIVHRGAVISLVSYSIQHSTRSSTPLSLHIHVCVNLCMNLSTDALLKMGRYRSTAMCQYWDNRLTLRFPSFHEHYMHG